MMSADPNRDRPARHRAAALDPLRALDFALTSQELEAEASASVQAFLPLLEGVERLCRQLDQLPPAAAAQRIEAIALLAELADRACAQANLERIGRPGEAVDRARHEVVGTTTRPDQPHGTVTEVVQYGWAWHGRLLCTARVIASVRDAPAI